MQIETASPIIHPLPIEDKPKVTPIMFFIGGLIIIFLGITTGYVLSRGGGRSNSSNISGQGTGSKQVVGRQDTKTFRDMAQGTLEANGINGEGTHKLIRPGGESQTVYLTSSVVDLNEFIGKKVLVRGETFAAKKAAWLMDVGVVEILE